MDPSYLYKLPANTHIFRAFTHAKEGKWYTMGIQEAFVYGTRVTEYQTNKELRMLNIMSLQFHVDLMDRLQIKYKNDDINGISNDKLKCLIALGLPSFDIQMILLKNIGYTEPPNTTNWTIAHDIASALLNNRHRISLHQLDTHLATVLEEIYGNQYDGFISPFQWPSKWYGNFFPREMCIFKGGHVDEIQEHSRPVTHSGGAASDLTAFNKEDHDSSSRYDKDLLGLFKKDTSVTPCKPFLEDQNSPPRYDKDLLGLFNSTSVSHKPATAHRNKKIHGARRTIRKHKH